MVEWPLTIWVAKEPGTVPNVTLSDPKRLDHPPGNHYHRVEVVPANPIPQTTKER